MSRFRLRRDRLEEVAAAKGDSSGYKIAKRTGISESTISRLRRGLAVPTTTTLAKLATTYDTEISHLIEEVAA